MGIGADARGTLARAKRQMRTIALLREMNPEYAPPYIPIIDATRWAMVGDGDDKAPAAHPSPAFRPSSEGDAGVPSLGSGEA